MTVYVARLEPEPRGSQHRHLLGEEHCDREVVPNPVTAVGEECERIQRIILDNLQKINMAETIQDLRVVKNQGVEAIIFQVPVSFEFIKTR